MQRDKLSADKSSDLSGLSLVSLSDLYNKTNDDLRQCSHFLPKNMAEDEAADQRELELLKFEAEILGCAARAPLKNTHDINKLIDLWEKVSAVNETADVRPSDKIAMNIFRHIVGRLD